MLSPHFGWDETVGSPSMPSSGPSAASRLTNWLGFGLLSLGGSAVFGAVLFYLLSGGTRITNPDATDLMWLYENFALWLGSAGGVVTCIGAWILSAAQRASMTELMRASSRGDAGAVASLLAAIGSQARQHDLDRKDVAGRTALIHAAMEGHAECVRLLLRAGAARDLTDGDRGFALDDSPFSWACQRGHAEVVKVLLEHGADANAKRNYAQALLAQSGHPQNAHEKVLIDRLDETLELCLAHGADPNLRFGASAPGNASQYLSNVTPLIYAVQKDRLNAAEMLLGAGAEPSLKDSSGRTALNYASSKDLQALLAKHQKSISGDR